MASRPSLRALRSLFVKFAAVMCLFIGLVVATMAVMSFDTTKRIGEQAVSGRALQVTRLIADESNGALKFGKADRLTTLLDEAIAASNENADGGIFLGADGMVLAEATGHLGVNSELVSLAQDALATGDVASGPKGLSRAIPIRDRADNRVLGVVATHWTTRAEDRAIAEETKKVLGLAAIAFVLSTLAAMLIFRVIFTRPLDRQRQVMEALAARDYAVEVPDRRRVDEIGQIGRTVQHLRDVLAEGEAAQREASYKSAAFEGSSAAMMLIDGDHVLKYANPAMRALLTRLGPHLSEWFPDPESEGYLGADLEDFLGRKEGLRKRLFQDRERVFSETLAFGDSRISLRFNAVQDGEGADLGRVIEWVDVTQATLNEAVLDTINSDQARAEFDTSGELIYANDRFAAAMAEAAEDLSGRSLRSLMDPGWLAAEGEGDILAKVRASGAWQGKLLFTGAAGQAIVDGGLSCVRDTMGQPLRYLMIGRDVTADETALAAARAERAELLRHQEQVVDALRIGLRRMSDGDFTARIEEPFAGDYEQLRQDYNSTVDTLCGALRGVAGSAENIRNEARDISTTADSLSRRTESTAATLEETAAALDELTTSVRSAAEGAARADKAVADARLNAEQSGRVVLETVEAMDQIASSSDKITSIINVIDDIAFQTNLLALNAGVEAARAGDAGRGFAVVASEVRALAQRSSDAAREINGLIAKSGVQVKRGVDLVGKTGEALKEIVTSVSGIAVLVSEIAGSSKEQSSGLAEINTAVNDLDQSTQQNAARLEETTAASQSLTNDATALVESVAVRGD